MVTLKCVDLRSSDPSVVLPVAVRLEKGRATCVYTDHPDVEYSSLDEAMAAHKVINPRDGRNERDELVLFSAAD